MPVDIPVVLIAEDDPQYRAGLKNWLRQLPAECILASDGHLAIEVIMDLSQRLDLVVTDMRMPFGSGWDVIRAVRAYRGVLLPIIMQSGEAQYEDVQGPAREFGVPLIAKADLRHQLMPAARDALGLWAS